MIRRLNFWTAVFALPALSCAAAPEPDLELTESQLLAGLIEELPNNFPFFNSAGSTATYSTRGSLDFTTPFHDALGTNGRSCGTCHLPHAGWSLRPSDAKVLFELTQGEHPLFRTSEANNPSDDVSNVGARRDAYSMLLNKAVFRRTFNVPATAEFEVTAVDDPYGVATATKLSLFRRPLATTNLHLVTGVAWENRTGAPGNVPAGLISQVNGNVTGAQQGTAPPAPEVTAEIVSWETSLSTAQQTIFGVGRLDTCGGLGGPVHLSAQTLTAGPFDLYNAWDGLTGGACGSIAADARRAKIARGQRLFNTALDTRGGTCSGCHNVANNGSNLAGSLFNVGASSASRRTPDMPLYTLRNLATGEIRQSSDPGRAMISGKWSDMDRFKVPTLRGITSRAPYFHNGIAANLDEVVDLYEESLGFNFSTEEQSDLVAFMNAL